MGYPKPIPVLKAKDVKYFEQHLENFQLTPQQRQFYEDARKKFKRS